MKSVIEKIKGMFKNEKNEKVDFIIKLNLENPKSISNHKEVGFERASIFEEDMLRYFNLLKQNQQRLVKVYYKF